jgi:hypothetical protein
MFLPVPVFEKFLLVGREECKKPWCDCNMGSKCQGSLVTIGDRIHSGGCGYWPSGKPIYTEVKCITK